jgi:hypothetical protein
MKRPNLVKNSWSPFKQIPLIDPPLSLSPTPSPVYIQEIPMTKKELIKRNSAFLNFVCLLIIISVGYFLYSIYLERKIFAEYLEHIQNNNKNDSYW